MIACTPLLRHTLGNCKQMEEYFCDDGGKPSHHGFSIAHTLGDMDRVLQATEDAVKAIQAGT
jgi:hypothetical protein